MDLQRVRACAPVPLQHFLSRNLPSPITGVEHAGAHRGHFLMTKGARQGCPASGNSFTMLIGPVFRWVMSDVLPLDRIVRGSRKEVLVPTPMTSRSTCLIASATMLRLSWW